MPFGLEATLQGQQVQGPTAGVSQMDQQELQNLLAQYAQMVQGQTPPMPQPVPQAPGLLPAGLSVLAAALGDALTRQHTAVPTVAGILGERAVAPKRIAEQNRMEQMAFEAQKNAQMLQLAKTRIDAQIESLQQQGKEKDAEKLALFRHNLEKDLAEYKRNLDISKPPPPREFISRRKTEVSGLPQGGEKRAAGGGPKKRTGLMTPSQYINRVSNIDNNLLLDDATRINYKIEAAARRLSDDTSVQDAVDRLDQIDPNWTKRPDAKRIAAKIKRDFAQ